jgi:ATP/maltotriose-dependent transcriptional regulator MalT
MEFTFRDVLSTKLSIPRARVNLVHRDRLIARLEEGVSFAFVLISAPAGYGKTTLVLDWLRSKGAETEPHAVAWFGLDEGDNDAARFIRGLAAALVKAMPGIGDSVAAKIQSPQLPPLRTSLTMLINELVASSREVILVLEDY